MNSLLDKLPDLPVHFPDWMYRPTLIAGVIGVVVGIVVLLMPVPPRQCVDILIGDVCFGENVPSVTDPAPWISV